MPPTFGEWPVSVGDSWAGSRVTLRRLHPRRDREEWSRLRRANFGWTAPWDSTSPYPTQRSTFSAMARNADREAKAGRSLPFVIDLDGELVGQMHLFGITRGALQGGAAGYWVDRRVAGRGIAPFALAMLIDHAFGPVRLHRVEVNIRPDNAASLRVVHKLGLRDEGIRLRYLHIAGRWHDHRTFAVTSEELAAETAVARFRRLSQASL
ncbi:GNAT family N-acetyltransferase [Dermacoccaceae bacterium W4C1]